MYPAPDLSLADHATQIWQTKVRFIGAGAIGVAAIGTIFFAHAESHAFNAAFTHTAPYVAAAFLLAAGLSLVLPKTAVADEHGSP